MEHKPRDRQADEQLWARPWVRRSVVGLLAGPLAGFGLGAGSSARKKKKKKSKKITLCLNGQTLNVLKKKRGALQRQGATVGACTPCVAACTGKPCGADDGCGGTCGCPAGQVCEAGSCHACTITCPAANPAACGSALQAKLDAGGVVYACPGRYVGTYYLTTSVKLVGAGQGDDPATSTILDGNQAGRVFVTDLTTNITVDSVRITGGKRNGGSAGVVNNGTLAMRSCTITGNVVTGSNGWGAGVRQTDESDGPLTLTECTISGNQSDNYGGGVAQSNPSHAVMLTNCTIADNRAGLGAFGDGGGVFCYDGSLQIAGGSITGNSARSGGGIKATGTGSVIVSGVAMRGNLPDNCAGVTGCPA